MSVYKDDPNLVSLWLLEEASGTRRDTIGNNDLSDNNTVGQSADRREGLYSADFEAGNSEYLSITDAAQVGLDITDKLTICLWIKPETLTTADLVSKWLSPSDKSYVLRLSASGHILADLSPDGSATTTAWTPAGVISPGTWYHVAFVYDGANIIIYIDGTLTVTGNNPKAYTGGIFNGTGAFCLGNRDAGSNYYDGLKDEVAIFDRALTADEINDIYTNGILTPLVYKTDPNLVSLWLMEELIAGSLHRDAIGSNHLVDNNNVGHSADAKEGRRSADFEADNSEYLSISDGDQTGLDITGDLSICFWIKPETVDGSSDYMVSKFQSSQMAYAIPQGFNATGAVSFVLSSDGSSYTSAYTPASTIGAGDWYHVACVYDGTDMRVYINGSLANNGSNNPKTYSGGIYNSTAAFQLGAGFGGNYYDGLMDEVAVFDRALSPGEVLGIYQYGILDEAPGAATLEVATIPSLSPIFHIRQED